MRISDWSSDVCSSDLLDQLKLGMTHEQVHYLIGTPIAASAFRPNRWDYVGYYKSPRGEVTERIVSLYFADNVLARMDGIAKQGETKAIDHPDVSRSEEHTSELKSLMRSSYAVFCSKNKTAISQDQQVN